MSRKRFQEGASDSFTYGVRNRAWKKGEHAYLTKDEDYGALRAFDDMGEDLIGEWPLGSNFFKIEKELRDNGYAVEKPEDMDYLVRRGDIVVSDRKVGPFSEMPKPTRPWW